MIKRTKIVTATIAFVIGIFSSAQAEHEPQANLQVKYDVETSMNAREKARSVIQRFASNDPQLSRLGVRFASDCTKSGGRTLTSNCRSNYSRGAEVTTAVMKAVKAGSLDLWAKSDLGEGEFDKLIEVVRNVADIHFYYSEKPDLASKRSLPISLEQRNVNAAAVLDALIGSLL